MERPVLRPIARSARKPPVAALLAALLAAALPCGFAASAAADVLVLRDGSRIETAGKWEQKGRQLIFKTAAGTLSTLRASEVDLAASEKATAEALAPKAVELAAKPAEKKPVLVLTNKDVPQASPETVAQLGGAPVEPPPAPGTGKVDVVSSGLEGAEGDETDFAVRGVVQNNTSAPVAEVTILVSVNLTRENDNRRLYCQTTVTTPLAPKGTADFVCPIRRQDVIATGMADVFGSAVLSFEVRASAQAAAPAEGAEGAEGAENAPQN